MEGSVELVASTSGSFGIGWLATSWAERLESAHSHCVIENVNGAQIDEMEGVAVTDAALRDAFSSRNSRWKLILPPPMVRSMSNQSKAAARNL